ncbi:hypothetical protein ACFW3D_33900 [Streptomyces sp. NPDC058864]
MTPRRADLTEAIEDGLSPSWSVRAAAGRRLAPYAGLVSATAVLERLLLDPEDTLVTRTAAEALLRQGSVAAVRLVARAAARADDNHGDWLRTAAHDVAREPGEAGRGVSAACAVLADDPDGDVRRGAAEVAEWFRR